MLYELGKKIFLLLGLMMFTVGNVSASEDHNLTDVQLHAVLGIITNFILSDVDSDGDGVYDSQDAFPHDPTESVDTDGDGIGNNADTDDDGDGASDVEEIAAGSDPLDPDDLAWGGKAYKVVTSPYTGHKWLDRNLGASQVCTSFDDASCYGDYYQWGRDADGHEDKNSATTSTLATFSSAGHNKFITGDADWVTDTSFDGLYPTSRAYHWSQRDGSSVCPVGFRVPTIDELSEETINNGVTNASTAFTNFLKVPSAGYRFNTHANMQSEGDGGVFWTSTYVDDSSSYIYYLNVGALIGVGNDERSYGLSVRCMKPIVTTDVPPVVTLHTSANISIVRLGSYPAIKVTAVDEVDGILMPFQTGSVNTSVAGTYTMSYTATDSAGQASNTVTVTVTVHSAMKKTGQTQSYDADGNEVTDGSLKDDGHYQKGHNPMYVRDDDNIVTDNITGLEWQDDVAAETVEKQWLTDENHDICTGENGATQDTNKCTDTSGDTAATYCAALSLGGHEDWRLPMRKELVDLLNYSQTYPAISSVFENVASNYYWSSTTYAGNSGNAWGVYFRNGVQVNYNKTYSYYVRCVRAGQ